MKGNKVRSKLSSALTASLAGQRLPHRVDALALWPNHFRQINRTGVGAVRAVNFELGIAAPDSDFD